MEILVAMSVAALAGFMLIQILIRNNGLLFQQSAKIYQGLNLNDTVSALGVDIKGANAVALGYPVTSPTILSSSSSLVLQFPSVDSNGNIIDKTYDYIIINPDSVQPAVLREQVFPDPLSSRKATNKVLLTNLSSIIFSYFDSNNSPVTPASATKVNFVLNLVTKAGVNQQQSSASAKFSLRNE